MLVAIHVVPHERAEAVRAYARFLTPELVEQIEDAASDRIIRLDMGGGPTRLTIEGRDCVCVVREAVEAEREACAKLADLQSALDRRNAERHRDTDNSFDDCAITAESIARAIRFRSTLETST